jgi:DsbC/DsbD-like thiol-disulfide interchange protein
MKLINLRRTAQLLLITGLLGFSGTLASTSSPQSPPDIALTSASSTGRIQRGRSANLEVTIEIPSGFHVHSNRPLEKFLIATQLQVEAPKGIRVGPVVYPRAVLRNLKFSKSKVSVYEGRTTMHFNITVPRNFDSDSIEVKARLRYQSCSDEVCFPPQTRVVTMPFKIKK